MKYNIMCKEYYYEEWIEDDYLNLELINQYLKNSDISDKCIYIYGSAQGNNEFIDDFKCYNLDIVINAKNKFLWFLPSYSRKFLFKLRTISNIKEILTKLDDYGNEISILIFSQTVEEKFVDKLKESKFIDHCENILQEDTSALMYWSIPEEEVEEIFYGEKSNFQKVNRGETPN